MRPVRRDEIVDYVTYTERRADLRGPILAAKAVRRLHVGDHLTFLFENRDTVRYQIQEMMRVERIVREKDIQHEIDTYNELLCGPGGLGCTLMIEIDSPELRAEKLPQWLGLNEGLYLELEGGARVRPSWDARQVGTDRLSSVQYLRFDTHGQVPVAIGCDFPDPTVAGRLELSPAQRAALAADLADDA